MSRDGPTQALLAEIARALREASSDERARVAQQYLPLLRRLCREAESIAADYREVLAILGAAAGGFEAEAPLD